MSVQERNYAMKLTLVDEANLDTEQYLPCPICQTPLFYDGQDPVCCSKTVMYFTARCDKCEYTYSICLNLLANPSTP